MAAILSGPNLSIFQETHMTASHIETVGAQRAEGLKAFLAAREFLFNHREDYQTTYSDFRWPQLDRFNWALDFFDVQARGNDRTALWIVDDEGRMRQIELQIGAASGGG